MMPDVTAAITVPADRPAAGIGRPKQRSVGFRPVPHSRCLAFAPDGNFLRLHSQFACTAKSVQVATLEDHW